MNAQIERMNRLRVMAKDIVFSRAHSEDRTADAGEALDLLEEASSLYDAGVPNSYSLFESKLDNAESLLSRTDTHPVRGVDWSKMEAISADECGANRPNTYDEDYPK